MGCRERLHSWDRVVDYSVMRVWVNGRRRNLKLTPAARSVGWLLAILFFLAINLGTLVHDQRLDWLSWLALAIGLVLLASCATSLVHQLRTGGRVRMTADEVASPSAEQPQG